MVDFKKTGLTWHDVDLVRNEVQHIVPAMDPQEYPDRAGMKYFLSIDMPEYPMSPTFDTLIVLEGREKPPVISAGAQIYEGCAFQLQELLAGQLSITPPAPDQSRMGAIASLTTPYRLREKIEPNLLDRTLSTRVAMRAGLAMRDFVGYRHTFFSRYQSELCQFLTWQPDNKVVSPVQKEYLYFLLNFSPVPEQIRLRVEVKYKNGSSEVITKDTVSGLRAFQVVSCPVGAAYLGLGETVFSYNVWLSDGNNNRFTEVRTYILDHRRMRNERFVLFSNSLGGFDTIRLLGKATEETEVSRATSRKERKADSGLDYSELEIIDITENSGIQLSTGFFPKNEKLYQEYLQELLLSEVMLLDTAYGFEAVNLVTSSLKTKEDDGALFEQLFEFHRTYSDTNYSRLKAAEKIPARATKWIGVSAAAVLNANGMRTGRIGYNRLQKVYLDTGEKVIPYEIKANLPGDPNYIPPVLEASIVPGTTPYPNTRIERAIAFKKNTCGSGYLGTAPIVIIEAGTYGGETVGAGDELAESKFKELNNQDYANANGVCELNNIPFHFAIFHKIPMTVLHVTGTNEYGPVLDLRVNGSVVITNTTGAAVPFNRISDMPFLPGKYTLVMSLAYGGRPLRPCKVRIPSKGLENIAYQPGFVIFENVQIDSADEPLTIEVVNI